MSDHIRFRVSKYFSKPKEEYRWRAFSRATGDTYIATSREKLWDTIKEDLNAQNVYKRKGLWIVQLN